MRKKTDTEKARQGTLRKDRSEGKEQLPYLDKVPSPGKHLNVSMTPRARKLYEHFGAKLVQTGRLTELDLGYLVNLANAWDKYIWAEQEMARKNAEAPGAGYIQTFKSGATNITTEFSIAKEAQDQIMKISKQFGMGFRDRHSISGYLSDSDPQQTSIWDVLDGDGRDGEVMELKVVGQDGKR